MGDLQPWHLLILAAVLVLLFGGKRLPGAARALGQSMRILKAETKAMHDDGPATVPTAAPAAPQLAAAPVAAVRTAPAAEQPGVAPAAPPVPPTTVVPPTTAVTPHAAAGAQGAPAAERA